MQQVTQQMSSSSLGDNSNQSPGSSGSDIVVRRRRHQSHPDVPIPSIEDVADQPRHSLVVGRSSPPTGLSTAPQRERFDPYDEVPGSYTIPYTAVAQVQPTDDEEAQEYWIEHNVFNGKAIAKHIEVLILHTMH